MKFELNLANCLHAATRCASEAGTFIRAEFARKSELDVRRKGHLDFVTQVDLESEKLISEELQKRFPEIGMLGEEGSRREGTSPCYWVVDPLDGTSNFVHGYPAFAVSIALVETRPASPQPSRGRFPEMAGTRPILGVIDDACMQRQFHACRGKGAWLRDGNGELKELVASKCELLEEAFLASGFPVRQQDLARIYGNIFARILPRCGGIRRGGSAALDLA